MIRFKCIYCGQKILAPDNSAEKKGKCPKCRHLLIIPKSTKDRPAISADISEELQRKKETTALFDITKDLPGHIELYKEKAGWFIPVYDELSLFLMAATLSFIFFGNSQMREEIYKGIKFFDDLSWYIFSGIIACGIGLSVYHVFSKRDKNELEKTLMLIFAVFTNAITGILAGANVINSGSIDNWMLVFPLWNIINGGLLLALFRFGFINKECIIDRGATFTQIIFGLTAILVIFLLCNYVFKMYWAITFSVCIVYATSFDKALQSVFPGSAFKEN